MTYSGRPGDGGAGQLALDRLAPDDALRLANALGASLSDVVRVAAGLPLVIGGGALGFPQLIFHAGARLSARQRWIACSGSVGSAHAPASTGVRLHARCDSRQGRIGAVGPAAPGGVP